MAKYFKTELTEAGGHANMLALCVFDIEVPFYYGQLDVTVLEECRLTMAAGQMGQMLSGGTCGEKSCSPGAYSTFI